MLDRNKYLSESEAKQLREFTEGKALLDLKKGRRTWVVRWMGIDFLLGTGCRVSEARKLRCGDVNLRREPTVRVFGKNSRWRTIPISTKLKRHMREFWAWKETVGEPTGDDDPFFRNRLGRGYSLSGFQSLFKACRNQAGLRHVYSVHSTRHCFGYMTFSKSKNIRLTQHLLGHRRLATTEIYTHVTNEELVTTINDLW